MTFFNIFYNFSIIWLVKDPEDDHQLKKAKKVVFYWAIMELIVKLINSLGNLIKKRKRHYLLGITGILLSWGLIWITNFNQVSQSLTPELHVSNDRRELANRLQRRHRVSDIFHILGGHCASFDHRVRLRFFGPLDLLCELVRPDGVWLWQSGEELLVWDSCDNGLVLS
jgi:hypothetical protein